MQAPAVYDRGVPFRPFADQNCSIAEAAAIFGDRWTLLVLRELLLGRRRFSEIQRNTGAAPNILSDRLRVLVEQGLLVRRRHRERPETHEYVLTPSGRDVGPVLAAILAWGDRHATPPDGPPRVFVHAGCGHDAHPELRCSHCGEAIGRGDLRLRPGPGADARQRAEPLLPAS
jgi:DNA-binding HxlR family transcriptional regulator